MTQPAPTCPKCSSPMELGYVPDYAHGGIHVGHWSRGRPRSAFFSFLDRLRIAVPIEPYIPIGTYRCQKCGFLESYAREEFLPK